MIRTPFLLPMLLGLLLLAACEDPSNVGIGLVDEQGNPEVRAYSASLFEADTLRDITGVTQRVLAGQVDDPLLGTITATGYVDFQSSTFDTTGAPTITGVSLLLRPDYVYGDTTSTVTMNLYDLPEDWVASGASADTTLPMGSLVTSVDLLPVDTLVTFALPESWVAANDTTLRSPSFEVSFHGFALEALAGNAAVGFDAGESLLRIFTNRDTLDYPMTRTLSGLHRSGVPNLPPDRLALQDGLGQSVRFNFAFDEAGLREIPLNGAIIRLFADTLSVKAAPTHFVRPLVQRLQLVGITSNASIFLIGEATLSQGFYRFSAPTAQSAISLRDLLQRTFFGEDLYDHFELRFPPDDNTISVMLLFDAGAVEKAPEVLLTVSPGA